MAADPGIQLIYQIVVITKQTMKEHKAEINIYSRCRRPFSTIARATHPIKTYAYHDIHADVSLPTHKYSTTI